MVVTAVVLFILIAFCLAYLYQPKFGKLASGERLERIHNSPNYRDGKFRNISPTPDLAEGVSYYTVLKEFIFDRSKRIRPDYTLPSQKTDLYRLGINENVLVWFGHSSYFMQIDGKKILVDPVFSGSASPVNFTTRSYEGSDVYGVQDIPAIDYLFISHDHWDHLNYETVVKLRPKVRKVITGLGVGAHLEHWGFDKNSIEEKDWDEEVRLDDGFIVNTTSARHFSGRGLKRQTSLWMSFVLKTPTMKIYLGGDSGYDRHFKTIGDKFGPFDLAILECGQYNANWKYIHMMPEEVVLAARDLRAKVFMPVHWSKFSLGQHAWDEPVIRVTAEAEKKGVPVIHPMIGEAVQLRALMQSGKWWEEIISNSKAAK